MKLSAVICAAGKGERAGMGKNKLLAPLGDAPALWWTLEKFASAKIKPVNEIVNPAIYYDGFDEVLVVASPADEEEIRALCAPFGFTVTEGGQTRTESVYKALKAVTGDAVVIHDGARPFITDGTIADCIKCLREYGSAVCALPATDTTVIANGGKIKNVPNRNSVYRVQTPQAFYTKDILYAYEKALASGETFTDDGSVYLRFVGEPHLFIGSEENTKLTYGRDFLKADASLPQVTGKRVGIGADVHPFGKNCGTVTLGGVKIPCDEGLIAHSDGDVVAHAVMDALLSAAGLSDIGHYFPDSDEKFLNADSLKLLEKVVQLIRGEGLAPKALSVTVQAEKPRLHDYIGQMKSNLAAVLDLAPKFIGISAGTCEGLGYIGRGMGITVRAIAVLG